MFHLHQTHRLSEYFHNKELDELYASVFLKGLALSLISIFVPVYLYQLGFSFSELVIFYIIHYAVAIMFFPIGIYTATLFGIKKTMAFGSLVDIAYYFSLAAIIDGVFYLIPATLFGVGSGMYYAGLHLDFAKSAQEKKSAREISLLRALTVIAVTIGPFLGALFIAGFTFTSTLYVVAGILVCSLLPLFCTKDFTYAKNTFSIRKALCAGSFHSSFAHYGEAIGGLAGAVFWPLFIFLFVANILSLGAIFSLASLFTVFFLFFLGKTADKKRDSVLRLGVYLHAPIWITRLFFLTPIGLFVNNLLSSISAHILQVPFEKLIYERAGKHAPANYLFFRELHLTIGRLTLLLLALVFNNFALIFVLAFASTFLYLLPLRKR